jgi:hypothetical protein
MGYPIIDAFVEYVSTLLEILDDGKERVVRGGTRLLMFQPFLRF